MTQAFKRPFTKLAAAVTGLSLKDGHCPTCTRPVDPTEFRDQISRREYAITGMCQSCQDGTFAGKPAE
jgi:hypothetical protein